MDAVERAIRSALERGNQDDRAFRERVYRSAHAALERALSTNTRITPEEAERRRAAFRAKVTEIEQEFIPAVADIPAAPEPDIDLPVEADAPEIAPQSRVAPRVPSDGGDLGVVPERGTVRPGGFPDDAIVGAAEARPQGGRRGGRRLMAWAFLVVTLVVALVIGGWFASDLLSPRQGGSVPNPPVSLEDEDFQPDGAPPTGLLEDDSDREWITLFSPDDPTSVNAPGGTVAEVVQDDEGPLMRIRSTSNGAAVAFDVGPGALEQIAGRSAVFSIGARAEEGQETQISISCDFGALGDCGRRRYLVGYERGDYLFEVELPRGTVTGPGIIAINPDVAGSGKALDIYDIRVSAE